MTRHLAASTLILALTAAPSLAQESTGAERIEISSAVFGGGLFVVPPPVSGEDASRSYVVSGAVTANLTARIGVEGDVGVALGRTDTHRVFGTVPTDQRTPNIMTLLVNGVYSPARSDRPFVPYVTAGVGALTVFGDTASPPFGLAPQHTYFVGSFGGGLRWFPVPHWGFRGDYRYLPIKKDDRTSPQPVVGSAHRVYAALVLTF
jgi:hypothetical protein